MPHTVRKLPGEPIIVVTYTEPFDYAMGFEDIKNSIGKIANGIEGPVFDIHDVSTLQFTFSKVVTALRNALLNPTLKGKTTTLGVGAGILFDLATKAASRRQYGMTNILLFPTPEEAISYARERLKQS